MGGATNMHELVTAFKLRRFYYSDLCHRCVPLWQSRTVNWSHEFFGIFGLQGGGEEPWETVAGSEIFCADPIDNITWAQFVESHTKNCDDQAILPLNRSSNAFLNLPTELLSYICSFLSLRSTQAMRNTCRKLSAFLSDSSRVWRDKAIDLHGDWCWELKDTILFPVQTTAWAAVLWKIELTRSSIIDAAASKRHAFFYDDQRRCTRRYEDFNYRSMLFDPGGRPKLPLGVQNRLRIWCRLESIGKDGKQIALQGQLKGLDPPDVEWNGVSRHADCPSCGRVNAISFNRLKILAGRTDLT